jgi:hypothetical protein
MQGLVRRGTSPNAAAVLVANRHWVDISKTHSAAVQLLKRNQRIFSGELIDALSRNGRAQLLEFKRRHPGWTVAPAQFDLTKSQRGRWRWSVVPTRVNLNKKWIEIFVPTRPFICTKD